MTKKQIGSKADEAAKMIADQAVFIAEWTAQVLAVAEQMKIKTKVVNTYDDMRKWIGGKFDPEKFDPKAATKAMKKGLPDWRDEEEDDF
jgi:hypothetical protein